MLLVSAVYSSCFIFYLGFFLYNFFFLFFSCVQDISESSLSRITACLCESDLCNVYRAPEEKRPDLLPVRKLPQTNPLPLDSQGGNKLVQVPQQQSSADSGRQDDLRETPRKVNEPASSSNRRADGAVGANSLRQPETSQRRKQTFHEDKPGTQCYSCGSLLNPNKKCDSFSREDKNQVKRQIKIQSVLNPNQYPGVPYPDPVRSALFFQI